MGTRLETLAAVLREARALLAIPDNCFAWSSWRSSAKALAEMDAAIAMCDAGGTPDIERLKLLFAPTGAIQEVSISSGWAEEFLAVAKRFDSAIGCQDVP